MKFLITICARGGSKGIPGKNVKKLNGKPLIAYTIEAAQKFAQTHDCVVSLSTDSEEIKSVAADFNLTTHYSRPVDLGTDAAGKVETIEDLLNFEERERSVVFDYIIDLDVTSPLRTVEDLTNAFSIISADEEALNLFSVNPAARNPYFNMVERKETGYYGLVKEGKFLSRQSAPAVYELNASFYFYKRKFFLQSAKPVIGNFSLIYKMPHTCFDLDHSVDFDFMEFLMANNKLGFELC